jgi:YbbR domain-containing protein
LQRFLAHLGMMGLSLLLAIIVWAVAVWQENPLVTETFGPIPIEVVNTPANMVIFGEVPKSLRVTLRVTEATWKELSVDEFRAQVNLAGLEPGLHDLPVSVDCADRTVRILETRPSRINIRLETIAEKTFEVRARVLDSPPLGYIDRPPQVTPSTVTLRGPAFLVEQVSEVAAELFLGGAKSSVKRAVDLVARNAQGEPISGVEIIPARATMEVAVDQRFGYKDVSVRAVIVGQVAPGYWISNITVVPSTVTVVGSPSALSSLAGYVETAAVDVGGATGDVVERVALSLPTGASVVPTAGAAGGGAEGNSALVTVAVAAIEGGQTVQRLVTIQGLGAGLVATPSPGTVDVIVSGPLPRLQALKFSDVLVVLNVYGLDPGIHKVVPSVVVPEGLKVTSVLPDTIEVEIKLEPSPTPTLTPIPIPTTTATTTP